MQVFQDLVIQGEPSQLAATVTAIRDALADEWTRDLDAERQMRANGLGLVACFACARRGRRPSATLFLHGNDERKLHVTNIVPHDQPELTPDEYNAILTEFAHRFVLPATTMSGAQMLLTSANADLEHWFSPETAKKLRLFCEIANKRTGSGHPADRQLWFDFIASAHEEGGKLDATTLSQWLVEEGGWSRNLANNLASEYEFARGLLRFTATARIGA